MLVLNELKWTGLLHQSSTNQSWSLYCKELAWFLCRINISLEICELISILLPRQVNKLAVSEAERKDQEESKQDQPIVFGGLPVFFVFSSEAL